MPGCSLDAYFEGPLQICCFRLPFILSPIKWLASNSSDLESLNEGEVGEQTQEAYVLAC